MRIPTNPMRGSIQLRLLVLSNALFLHFAASWSPSRDLFKYSGVAEKLQRHPVITVMSAVTSDHDDRLILSNMHKIGLVTDESSKLRLLLASRSPRRREILDMMGLSGRYKVQVSPLDEDEVQIELAEKNYPPQDYARTLAERKAQALAVTMPHPREVTLIIGSDTIVDLDGSIMNKPKDEADAFDMIKRLSGKWHKVHTGVAVYAVGLGEHDRVKLMFSFADTANVKFADLADNDILSYIATREPMDKAGSYGIQGVGGQFVERLEGDYFTIMGLSMHRLSKALSQAIRSLDI
ncbi:hypothetical protein ACHAXA_004103 [Cyclostephanos tholiformis]|uniref:Uncharacterized protein n=1 Tax=Cyclostephanos tholiformis TaxID=382380 RepID=A0ABD3SHE4_9STRA